MDCLTVIVNLWAELTPFLRLSFFSSENMKDVYISELGKLNELNTQEVPSTL